MSSCGGVPAPKAESAPKEAFLHSGSRCIHPASLEKVLEEETFAAAEALRPVERLKWKIVSEFQNRVEQTKPVPPVPSGGFDFFTQTKPGGRFPILYRREKNSSTSKDEVLVDFDTTLAAAESPDLRAVRIADDNTSVAFTASLASNQTPNLFIKLPGNTPWQLQTEPVYEMEWATQGKAIYYSTLCGQRPCRLFRIILTPPSAPELLLDETRGDRYLALSKTRDRELIVVASETAGLSDQFLIDASASDAILLPFQAPEAIKKAAVEKLGDDLLFLERGDDTSFLTRIPIRCPGGCQAERVFETGNGQLIRDFLAFKEMTILKVRSQSQDSLVVLDRAFKIIKEIRFPPEPFSLALSPLGDFESETFRFTYSSLARPTEIHEFDRSTGNVRVIWQDQPTGFFADNYMTERLNVPVEPGKAVPVSLVYRKSLFKKGLNPLWVAAYGAYGHDLSAEFSSQRLSLLDRGFVFALIHVRGGGELGSAWHKDGNLLNKDNGIRDFLTSIHYLHSVGYGDPRRTTAYASSAGGVIAAAALNREPQLFSKLILEAPFLDITSTMLDAELPHTVREYEEWGNPGDPRVLSYIRSYSPYDNLKPQIYPPVLLFHNIHDQIISPERTVCWARHLRRLNTSSNPVLLVAGRYGSHARYADTSTEMEQEALKYAFAIRH